MDVTRICKTAYLLIFSPSSISATDKINRGLPSSQQPYLSKEAGRGGKQIREIASKSCWPDKETHSLRSEWRVTESLGMSLTLSSLNEIRLLFSF